MTKVTIEELLIHEGELMKKEYNFKKMKGKKNPHVKKTVENYEGLRDYDAGGLKQTNPKAKQDRHPNFRGDSPITGKKGQLYLVRCFVCGGERGTENYAGAVASGQCAWCGWKE
jgi:hypothetical protein